MELLNSIPPALACTSRRWWQRQEEQVAHRPPPTRQSRCHRRCPLSILAWPAPSTAVERLDEGHTQGGMRPHKVVVATPPLEMNHQCWGCLRRRPRSPRQGRYTLPERQIHPFHKCCVQPPAQPQRAQCRSQVLCRAPTHGARHPHHLPPSIDFLDLSIDQAMHHLPLPCAFG